MDREETGDEETTVHVEAWMEDDRVLICFYVDPEDLGGTSDDDSESPIIIDTYVGEPLGQSLPVIGMRHGWYCQGDTECGCRMCSILGVVCVAVGGTYV